MTYKEALIKSIELWTLMYKDGINKRKALTLMGYMEGNIINDCFLCTVRDDCEKCPLLISEDIACTSEGQPYKDYLEENYLDEAGHPATLRVLNQLKEALNV